MRRASLPPRLPLLVLLAALAGASPSGTARGDPPAGEVANPVLARALELSREGLALLAAGKYAEATERTRESLALYEQELGPRHRDVAITLADLATMLTRQSRFAEAVAPCERAIALLEALGGPQEPELVQPLMNLAQIRSEQGNMEEALALVRRAVEIRRAAVGPDHPSLAAALNNLGYFLGRDGQHAQALHTYEVVLGMKERAKGPNDPDLAVTLGNMSVELDALGRFEESLATSQRALDIRRAALPPDHPDLAVSLHNLAGALHVLGAHAKALELQQEALGIFERALGAKSPAVATTLNGMASTLEAQGSYAEAKPLYERALAIMERVAGPEHPATAMALGNLGGLLHRLGQPREALACYERALAIQEKRLAPDRDEITTSLNNLGAVHGRLGDPARAREFYDRALARVIRLLGPDHPQVAVALSNLAQLAPDGDLQGSIAQLERAQAIWEAALGPDHPRTFACVGNRAAMLANAGRYEPARDAYREALARAGRYVRSQIATQLDPHRRELVRTLRGVLDGWARMAPNLHEHAYLEVLELKGLVGRVVTTERWLARHARGADAETLAAARAAERRVAALANKTPAAPAARAAWLEEYAAACAERDRLTRDLGRRLLATAPETGASDVTLARVQAGLAPEEVLVDFLCVGTRYLAWIVPPRGEPLRVDLGETVALEDRCAAFVAAIVRDGGRDAAGIREAGTALRQALWAPLEARLPSHVTSIVLCPDAALASVPYAALPAKEGDGYLGEERRLSYVMDPGDLLPRMGRTAGGRGALLIGDVDYASASPGEPRAPPSSSPSAAPRELAHLDRAPQGRRFDPLPGTRREIEDLRPVFGEDARLLAGPDATEARLRALLPGRRVLHVATHGFVRDDLRSGLRPASGAAPDLSLDAVRLAARGHDAMALAGLALAGANPRAGGGDDDGVLTALEASHLDADGVDLVTLSACETAKGTAASGEGVQGLVQGFQQAGARDVVASLWKVDDEATQRLMSTFYAELGRRDGTPSPAAALQTAAKALRTSEAALAPGAPASATKPYAAPRFWAAFVVYVRR